VDCQFLLPRQHVVQRTGQPTGMVAGAAVGMEVGVEIGVVLSIAAGKLVKDTNRPGLLRGNQHLGHLGNRRLTSLLCHQAQLCLPARRGTDSSMESLEKATNHRLIPSHHCILNRNHHLSRSHRPRRQCTVENLEKAQNFSRNRSQIRLPNRENKDLFLCDITPMTQWLM